MQGGRALRAVLALAVMTGPVGVGAEPASAVVLRPEGNGRIIDIQAADIFVTRSAGRAVLDVRYAADAPGWDLADQELRMNFDTWADRGCPTSYEPSPLLVTVQFPGGASTSTPTAKAKVQVDRKSKLRWRYTITSPLLRGRSLNCVWVAVGDGSDWEWYINAGALVGKF